MFDLSIKFEELFWQVYEEEVPKYDNAIQRFKLCKKRLNSLKNGEIPKKYTKF
jgi:hypothetical protein